MNRIFKTCFEIIFLILLSVISVKAQEPQTIARIAVTEKSFDPVSDGGWMAGYYIHFVSLSVYLVNLGDTIVLLNTGDPSNNNVKTIQVPISKEDNLGDATLMFVIKYHHKHWGFASHEFDVEKTYSSDSFNLNSTFSNSFATNGEEYDFFAVFWGFNYTF